MNIAVFVSGNGSNLQALIDAERKGLLSSGKIVLVVCDNPDAYAIQRAEKAGIPVFLLEAEGFKSREEYDRKISGKLRAEKIELVVLAGFMRILSDFFINEFRGALLNIHPSLLPAFKGAHAIKDAFERRGTLKETGVTVHFVTEELDSGPIIKQVRVKIEKDDTLESLEERVHAAEHSLYPEVVRLFVEGKISIENREQSAEHR